MAGVEIWQMDAANVFAFPFNPLCAPAASLFARLPEEPMVNSAVRICPVPGTHSNQGAAFNAD